MQTSYCGQKENEGSAAHLHSEEANVLSKRRCPHTGIVNYYTEADPFMAVGSVAHTHGAPHYAWRCYLHEEAGGTASDLALAEALLRRAIAGGRAAPVAH